MASLTYAAPRQDKVDSVFPGENWFFYWKSAASLWESKIRSLAGHEPLYVPINWAFHDDGQGSIDFGQKRADCDLKRIEQICNEAGREVYFLVPIGSFPFLANGGVPPSLVKYASLSKRGLLAVCFDRDNKLNKLTSFYDPQIFKRDYSKGFELGFSRYIRAQAPEGKVTDAAQEETLKENYQTEILKLFYTITEESFPDRHVGKIQVAFLGGCPIEIFKRNQSIENFTEKEMKSFLNVQREGIVPSTILLNKENREPLFQRFLNENMTPAHFHENVENLSFTDDEDYTFKNLYQFEVFGDRAKDPIWSEIGLQRYFDKNYSGLIYRSQSLQNLDKYESRLSRVFIVPGSQLDEKGVRRVLKLFMASGRVIIDKAGMSEQVLKKFNSFFLENDLLEKDLYFLSPVTHYQLNEGSVTIIDSSSLKELSSGKQEQFWQKLIGALNLNHQTLEGYKDVLSTWHSRPAMSNELSYIEIRRLGIYNPTSYKSKVKIDLRKDFSLLKVLDEEGVKTQKNGTILHFDFAPGGAIKLDFGLFELE